MAITAVAKAATEAAEAAEADAAVTGAPGPTAWRLRHRNGTSGTFELTSVPLSFEGRTAWLQAAHDLGRLHRTEEALRELRRRYRDIVETATEGVWIIDAEARTTFVNATMAQMMDYAPADMIGRPLTDSAAIVERQGQDRRAAAAPAQILSTGSRTTVDGRSLVPGGSTVANVNDCLTRYFLYFPIDRIQLPD